MGLSLAAAAAFALSAPLTRLTLPVSPAEVTFWRLALAAALALILARGSRAAWQNMRRRRTALLGAAFFLHFLFFTTAAQTTTTAHALALTYTSPVLVVLGSALLLREPPRPLQVVGALAAAGGVAVLVGFEPAASGASWTGDLAALGSGAALAAYVLAGRYYRRASSLTVYVAGVYGWAALWAAPLAVVSFDPDAYDTGRVLVLLFLGLVPLGIGHTLLNAALRRAPPVLPNVITTQEIPGGVLLGALLYGDVPGPTAVLGALGALAGVMMVIVFGARGRRAGGRAGVR